MSDTDLFTSALSRMEEAAHQVAPDPDVLEVLRAPKEMLTARLTVRMDDGSRKSFLAWRCRYDDSRGPTKGGIRFHPDANAGEVESLAFWMTFKCAVANLPFGGGKGAVRVDPKRLSHAEIERLSRAYVRAFAHIIGPDRDIPAPDVSTNAMIMGWMADEYAALTGAWRPGVITGKPVALGGSLGREEATALGGQKVFDHLAERIGLSGPQRIAIQGLGNVGLTLARLFAQAGHRIVAVADSTASLTAKDGLDIAAVAKAKLAHRKIADLAGGGVVSAGPETLIGADCDLLVPAALQDALTRDNAGEVKAKAVLEMANGPTTPDADRMLRERGVVLIPDILANGGGVIVSYFEWVQNRQGVSWTLDEVNRQLAERIETEAQAVWTTAQESDLSLRSAAYVHGLQRLSAAITAQGIAPDFPSPGKSTLPGD